MNTFIAFLHFRSRSAIVGAQIQLQNDFVKIILFSTVNISGQALDHD